VLSIATLYPEALGTYGDGGNALALAHRAHVRGYRAESLAVPLGSPLPDADVYLLGGGEDGPQRQAADALRSDGTLATRVGNGAIVLAVCAGLQILGHTFEVAGGRIAAGVGLVDAETRRGAERRVGNAVIKVDGRYVVGFENHGGDTHLGGDAPLGAVVRGYGNNGAVDGVNAPGVLGTYLHGPVLALNPWLCDLVLERVTGEAPEPYVSVADDLYQARLAALL
jgi:CobQ-like glutamine amidotransferase family enzyme